ncbi:MAG: SDR family oxidoreductase [Desulfobacterales bacterium]
MRLLILGGSGMLGHQLLKWFERRCEVRATLRRKEAFYATALRFNSRNSFFDTDACNFEQIAKICADFNPDAVINCIGVIKQRDAARAAIPSITINALFPQQLAELCRQRGIRMIHLSTDCVFSGRKGAYREEDFCDADDLYGRTKLLGEVGEPGCITLRTSIIGPELYHKQSLLEWFLAQQGQTIKGFKNAIYSGFTTCEMCRIIAYLLTKYPQAAGIYHVSSEPISKYDLLTMIRDQLALDITIEPDLSFHCDRSLNSERFGTEFNYRPPSWEKMIAELTQKFKEAPQ